MSFRLEVSIVATTHPNSSCFSLTSLHKRGIVVHETHLATVEVRVRVRVRVRVSVRVRVRVRI